MHYATDEHFRSRNDKTQDKETYCFFCTEKSFFAVKNQTNRHLPVLAALGSSSELLRLSLRFLDDVADELRSFLDSDLHSDVKGISDFGRLRDNQGGSSLFGS